jgi:tetratricopeptide (TPR) repeat protein
MQRRTTRMAGTVVAAVTLLGALAPAIGVAQPGADAAAADAERRTRARGYASAGIAAHNRGSYDEAIALYEKAYAELPHPALFFNMAQAHRLAGRRDQALALYRRYLTEAPDGELAGQARTWIDSLETEAGVRGPAPAAPATGDPQQAVAAPGPAARADRGRALRLGAYGAGAASLIALGVGTVYGIKARNISDELSEPNVVYREARFQDGESAETSMFVWYGVGGALLVGGVVLYFLGQPADEAPATALAPIVGPDGAGVSWSARF